MSEKEEEKFSGELADKEEEVATNWLFIEENILSEAWGLDEDLHFKKDSVTKKCFDFKENSDLDIENPASDCLTTRYHKIRWIETCHSNNAMKKSIQILNSQLLLSQQQQSIWKILTVLVYYWQDKRLRSHYRKFKRFIYHSMLIENKKESGFWPGCLSQKDWYLIIDIQTKPDLKKRYSKEVQSLCKT